MILRKNEMRDILLNFAKISKITLICPYCKTLFIVIVNLLRLPNLGVHYINMPAAA